MECIVIRCFYHHAPVEVVAMPQADTSATLINSSQPTSDNENMLSSTLSTLLLGANYRMIIHGAAECIKFYFQRSLVLSPEPVSVSL
jgi:hypothetical protein